MEMKEKFIKKNLSQKSLDIINQADEIMKEYDKIGMVLTLRQLYYQFVARGYIENSEKSYDKIGTKISDGRLLGKLDWSMIEDRGRIPNLIHHWDNVQRIFDSASSAYTRDKWEGQEYYIEVWIEKEALINVIEGVCQEYNVASFACKGYVSQSAMYNASRRFELKKNSGFTPILIYLGDHDPSGMQMTEDIFNRIELFMGGVKVERLALNMNQVEEFNPPPNPAKMEDTRAKGYIKKYGTKSWELDALPPMEFYNLISNTLDQYTDKAIMNKIIAEEAQMKEKIKAMVSKLDI